MKFDNVAALREDLERMESQQLDEMLREELRKETPDGCLVRAIGSVLRARGQEDLPEITPEIRKSWARYQEKTKPKRYKGSFLRSGIVKAASLILVLLTLAALLPREAEAMNFFERFIAWTESVFSLISPAESKARDTDYEFRTNHLGLQEVYDKVTELGVTVPVVPSWLPEGYELKECKINEYPNKTSLAAVFANGTLNAVYQLDVHNNNISSSYSKDANVIRTVEMNNIDHIMMRNKELLVAVWAVDNIECAINIDCEENELNRILKSIYMMEDN